MINLPFLRLSTGWHNAQLAVAVAFWALAPTAALALCNGMELHAHRGAFQHPENSLSSVQRAYSSGWDGAEIDIQLLSDGSWVLNHDIILGRTTSVSGRRPSQLNLNEWGQIRLKERSGNLVSAEAPATLVDVLSKVESRPDKVLNIEVKELNPTCDAAESVSKMLHDTRPDGRWFFTSINENTLKCLRAHDPGVYLGLVVLDPSTMAKEISKQGGKGKRRTSAKVEPLYMDVVTLSRLKKQILPPFGIHIDTVTLEANPSLLENAKSLEMPVYTYSLESEKVHAAALRSYAKRSGYLPTGAIIDGDPTAFCAMLGKL